MKKNKKTSEMTAQLPLDFFDEDRSLRNNVLFVDFLKKIQQHHEEKCRLEIIRSLRAQANKLNW